MKLIGSAASPYVRKVRVVLAEKRLDYQFVIEDVWAADTTIAHSNPWGRCLASSWKAATRCSIRA